MHRRNHAADTVAPQGMRTSFTMAEIAIAVLHMKHVRRRAMRARRTNRASGPASDHVRTRSSLESRLSPGLFVGLTAH